MCTNPFKLPSEFFAVHSTTPDEAEIIFQKWGNVCVFSRAIIMFTVVIFSTYLIILVWWHWVRRDRRTSGKQTDSHPVSSTLRSVPDRRNWNNERQIPVYLLRQNQICCFHRCNYSTFWEISFPPRNNLNITMPTLLTYMWISQFWRKKPNVSVFQCSPHLEFFNWEFEWDKKLN